MWRVRDSQGFSLIELAIVMLVVALLIGTLISRSQVYWQRAAIKQAERELEHAKEALLGYVLSHGQLPCPDIDGFPAAGSSYSDGLQDRQEISGACRQAFGFVPWAVLGVSKTDPWGTPYFYHISTVFSDGLSGQPVFTLDDMGVINVSDQDGRLIASNIAAVIYSIGANANLDRASFAEAENIDNDNSFIVHDYTVNSAATVAVFDDIVRWLSPMIIKARMVAAERLPD